MHCGSFEYGVVELEPPSAVQLSDVPWEFSRGEVCVFFPVLVFRAGHLGFVLWSMEGFDLIC